MKTILMSIHPEYCYKIFDTKEKIIEIRKTCPEPPFKVLTYMTCDLRGVPGVSEWFHPNFGKYRSLRGNVIGEFIVEKAEKFCCCHVPYQNKDNLGYENFIGNGVYRDIEDPNKGMVFERYDRYLDTMLNNADFNRIGLSPQQLYDYLGGYGKKGYAWHIIAPKLYDEPKEIGEFKTTDKKAVKKCEYRERGIANPDYTNGGILPTGYLCNKDEDTTWCRKCKTKSLTRPLQSWIYVQDPEEV